MSAPEDALPTGSAPPTSPAGPRLRPWVVLLILVAVTGWGIAFWRLSDIPDFWYLVIAGWAFIAAGMAAWARNPENRTGRLMVGCGFLFFFTTIQAALIPPLWTIGILLQSLFAPVLFYLVFAFPEGKLTSSLDRTLVALTVIVVAAEALPLVFFDPSAPHFGCFFCSSDLNLLLIRSEPGLYDAIQHTVNWVIAVLAILFALRLIARWKASSSPRRRVLGALVLSTSIWLLAHAVVRVVRTFHLESIPIREINIANSIVLALIPFAFLLGLYRMYARRSRVADMMVELAEPSGRSHV